MLEIVLLYFLCKSIGDVITNKGRVPIGYQVLAVVMWFGGEFFAVFLYLVYLVVAEVEPQQAFDLSAWLIALAGGGVGGGIAYFIAHVMPPAADPTLQDAYTSFGTVQPEGVEGVQTYDSLEQYTNLSSAKYLQNTSPGG